MLEMGRKILGNCCMVLMDDDESLMEGALYCGNIELFDGNETLEHLLKGTFMPRVNYSG
jgi:hypothetical protein